MERRSVMERFTGELQDNIKHSIGKPYLFERPFCATCKYWYLLAEHAMKEMSLYISPTEAQAILRGIAGEIKGVEENGEIVDTFRSNTYHGFCKRNPPIPRGGQSTPERGLLSLFLMVALHHKPKRIASHWDWPITPHDELCGMWEKGSWVNEFLRENGLDPQTLERINKDGVDATS